LEFLIFFWYFKILSMSQSCSSFVVKTAMRVTSNRREDSWRRKSLSTGITFSGTQSYSVLTDCRKATSSIGKILFWTKNLSTERDWFQRCCTLGNRHVISTYRRIWRGSQGLLSDCWGAKYRSDWQTNMKGFPKVYCPIVDGLNVEVNCQLVSIVLSLY